MQKSSCICYRSLARDKIKFVTSVGNCLIIFYSPLPKKNLYWTLNFFIFSQNYSYTDRETQSRQKLEMRLLRMVFTSTGVPMLVALLDRSSMKNSSVLRTFSRLISFLILHTGLSLDVCRNWMSIEPFTLKFRREFIIELLTTEHPWIRDTVCHFELKLNYRYTMSCMDDFGSHENGPGWFPVDINSERRPFLTENTFYYKNETRFFDPSRSGISWRFLHLKTVHDRLYIDPFWRCIFGKGGKAGVVEINDHYPAPPMHVMEGALVHIKVINNILGGVAPTIHFHGFKMSQGYYWYDGVVGLTQCGIDPHQSFTYSFIASEVGIRWFHGHSSGVKLDGLYGAFIGTQL